MKGILHSIYHYAWELPTKLVAYVRARLLEKSTWVGVSAGVAGAAALAPPWSYVTVAIAVVMALLPTTTTSEQSEG